MTFKLPTDKSGIPLIGIGSGTYYYKKDKHAPVNEQLVKIFTTAVKEGFVHLDSAEVYGNDAELRDALKQLVGGGFKREDIFITDKYYAGDGSYSAHSPFSNPYERIKSLVKELNTSYVDLYLLHAPFIKKESHGFDLKEAWKYLQQAKDEGLAKRIGVSNFGVEDLKEIIGTTATDPEVNQIEYNAFLQNQTPGIVEFSQSHNIAVEAYSPLAPITSGDLTQGKGLEFAKYLEELGAKYGKTNTQILLRWVIQTNVIPITTTSKVERLQELKGVFGWELEASEVSKISELGKAYGTLRKYWKPEYSKYD
ncbi:NADPH-dependent conjugated polyketone reductase C1 [Pichia kudriavzevii]|uniref:2-dehydropantolactone reductase n=1 Tax=Pichia kudriavzevii TaxID=4909 RepID=A0A1V2LJW1_PICKU|nr:NADPH-dependent conjugated polyketone reductase C1 [Pichia kudriavzevii]